MNSSYPSINPLIYRCSTIKSRLYILITVFIVKFVLIVPPCIFILHQGVLQWRWQRSFRKQNHSDVFTYHLAVMEFMWLFGFIIFYWGEKNNVMTAVLVGICMSTVNFYGEIFFHILTCVERYLAVVHSITYRGLRSDCAVRIRNISIFCVWLLCGTIASMYGFLRHDQATIAFFCVLPFSIVVVSFCSLTVLCVLNRPGPGSKSRESQQIDQSKRRAFHTILSILSVLWLWFIGLLFVTALQQSRLFDETINCMLGSSLGVFNVPSSLVLPLLYLHRRGKLPCVCSTSK